MLLVVEFNNSGNISQTRKLCVKKKHFFRKKESSWCTYIKLRVRHSGIDKGLKMSQTLCLGKSHFLTTKHNSGIMQTETNEEKSGQELR